VPFRSFILDFVCFERRLERVPQKASRRGILLEAEG
jgi:hypothetical protein